jgi:putative intracellular protease/amidase
MNRIPHLPTSAAAPLVALLATLALHGTAPATAASAGATPSSPAAAPSTPSTPKKVLIVVSSEATRAVDRPGFDMEEFAQAYGVLHANGLQIDVASPDGGEARADRFDPQDDAVRALPPQALQALKATRRTADVRAGEHDAVFIVGGKGAMFDLPRDGALATYLAAQHARGAVLAAVCHGPAALVPVLVNGRPLLQGRRVTGFTNEEETVFGKRWAREYPWWLENQARQQGASWEEAPLMMPKLVVDGRLVTGQNPFSVPQAAEAVVRLLGQAPVARAPFVEEASMRLVTRWLAGERDGVQLELATEPARHKPALIAMLGHYQHQAATDDASRRRALAVMELAAPHFQHPQFVLSLAQARAAAGQKQAARELLVALQGRSGLDAETRGELDKALAAL